MYFFKIPMPKNANKTKPVKNYLRLLGSKSPRALGKFP